MPSISVDCDVYIWLCTIGVFEDDFPIHHTIPFTSKVRTIINDTVIYIKVIKILWNY